MSDLSEALARGFMTARSYVDYQIIISFDKLEDMQAAHKAIIEACTTALPSDVGNVQVTPERK